MTDAEADSRDEYYTKNPPKPGPNGTGFYSQRRKAALMVKRDTFDYTEWRRGLWNDMTIDENYAEASAQSENR